MSPEETLELYPELDTPIYRNLPERKEKRNSIVQEILKPVLPLLIAGTAIVTSLVGCTPKPPVTPPPPITQPTPQPPVTINPVEEEAKNLVLSSDIISRLKPLGEDGMDKNEKDLIYEISTLSPSTQASRRMTLTLEPILQDNKISTEEVKSFIDVFTPVTVKGVAFHDCNGNGTKEEDEPIIPKVKLNFFDELENQDFAVETGIEGAYNIKLLKGKYTLSVSAENVRGYNNQPYRFLNISKEEFRPIEMPWFGFEINGDMDYNIKLMQGYLTLPFPKGTLESYPRIQYSDVDSAVGVMRDWKGTKQTYDNHRGTDFFIPTGTPILAAAPGIVVQSKDFSGLGGNYIAIQHIDRNLTIYSHLDARNVHVGDRVERGYKVGVSGSSGGVTRSQLDFQFGDFGDEGIDPYRDITNPMSLSWWTVDNNPRYP